MCMCIAGVSFRSAREASITISSCWARIKPPLLYSSVTQWISLKGYPVGHVNAFILLVAVLVTHDLQNVPPASSYLFTLLRERVMGLGSSVISENRDSLNGANTNGVKERKPTPAGLLPLPHAILIFYSIFLRRKENIELNLSLFTTFVKYIIEFHIFISVKGKYSKLFILWRQGEKRTNWPEEIFGEQKKNTLLEAKITGLLFHFTINWHSVFIWCLPNRALLVLKLFIFRDIKHRAALKVHHFNAKRPFLRADYSTSKPMAKAKYFNHHETVLWAG